VGDSISVSGACLTAVTIESRRFQADISPETLDKTTFKRAKIGDRVNLERALVLSDRIDGHLVSGHVDGTGLIRAKQPAGNATLVTIEVPVWMSRYIISKGSVAVDGISLTVNTCGSDRFEVSIIPHTGKITTIGLKQNGAHVNIETDMIGKYVERFMDAYPKNAGKSETSKVDMNLLARTGFLNT
jgi:riboflavin synthase